LDERTAIETFANGEIRRFEAHLDDPQAVIGAIVNSMIHEVGRDPEFATARDWYYALAFVLRGLLSENNVHFARNVYRNDAKRVYYLSMEYLPGQSLTKYLLDLNLYDQTKAALQALGQDLNEIQGQEPDAALGNGGLGRLASCILDSIASHCYPGFGYGIRYEYGIFTQTIENGEQVEHPDNWLRYGNPWEFMRPSIFYPVRFGGRVLRFKDEDGVETAQWVDTDEVIAVAFDTPVSGYRCGAVSNLRLWSARSSRDFDLRYFNEGDYIAAVRDKTLSENLSKVLYPNDKTQRGHELRLRQEFFFVSASIQDLLARFVRTGKAFAALPDEVTIQLNDTHPVLAIPELVRLLVDHHNLPFDDAWTIAQRTFAYTNHTLLPEALETWPIDMLSRILPRHLEIIYEINDQFLRHVRGVCPGDAAVLGRVSLVNDQAHAIRMAHLAIAGSEKVNGVSELHTKLLRSRMFADFDRIFPGKFVNVTNGITQRLWLLQANPKLAALITDRIGDGWISELEQLKALESYADDPAFQQAFLDIKRENKAALAKVLRDQSGVEISPDTIFDVHVKRIHEYKRQLLNLLHVITRYNAIRDGSDGHGLKRTIVIGGKAAPSYTMAKLIVRLVGDVADTINNDPAVGDSLRLLFFPNYGVSAAELIIPAADLSEQISTAGTEASGTGNMKFALNGALTIGTLDGANIEIRNEVGEDNIFIFGLNAEEVQQLRRKGYDPWQYYNDDERLKTAIDMIGSGFFCPEDPGRYRAIVDALLRGGDQFMLLADYGFYVERQNAVEDVYAEPAEWARRAILNVANTGKFSSDRTVHTYAREIWGIEKIKDGGAR
jgi:starch phosphorylase